MCSNRVEVVVVVVAVIAVVVSRVSKFPAYATETEEKLMLEAFFVGFLKLR